GLSACRGEHRSRALARARAHAALYHDAAAFYDLYRTGRQARMATDIKDGDECIAATPVEDGEIEFRPFRFTHERVMEAHDEPGVMVRVFYGRLLRSVRLPKAEAARTAPYSIFFNRVGDFKRPSVITPRRGRRPALAH